MRTTLTATALSLALATPGVGPRDARAGEEAPARESLLRFLGAHVIGRTVESSVTYRGKGEPLENVFTRRTTFANLATTRRGLAFDAVHVIRQTIYDLDGRGRRVGAGRAEDRVVISRYEVQELESVGRLRGLKRIVSNTDYDTTGVGSAVAMKLEGDRLVIERTTIGLADLFAAGGKKRPGVSEIRSVLSVEGGRLGLDEVERAFYVDPETLGRTPVSDPVRLKGAQVD